MRARTDRQSGPSSKLFYLRRLKHWLFVGCGRLVLVCSKGAEAQAIELIADSTHEMRDSTMCTRYAVQVRI